MDIGVGLPMKALEAEELAEFAHTIESGPFASLSLGDRIAYECHDALTAIAYLAAITTRLRLSASVVCLPLYREGVVAKQAATIDRLSRGRLSLGLGLGGRETDFAVSPAPWAGRGAKFEEQLATMQRIWRGEPPFAGTNPVGPTPFTPGGPEVIIGGFVPAAMRRAGRMAHGLRSFAFAADTAVHLERYAIAKQAWDEAGRPGRPRLIAACNFALGPGAHDAFVKHAHAYYGYDQALLDDALSSNAPTSPKAILEFIEKCEADGIDELVFTTVTADTMTAMHELADVVARR
jgi:alkanesulfonate monooxygenase SsuD/methylene tetrahydromethanopterin reductase-like flavin-dependent oxidoreductase (luciferase family)